MVKQQFIDSLHNLLGEALREHIEPQDVEVAINDAYNQICLELFQSGRMKYDLCRKRFTDVAVTWDSDADVYYSTYPAAIVPDINMDMIVETIRGSDLLFYPSSEKTRRRVKGLQSNDLNNHIPTILKRERIEYDNMESLTDAEIVDGATPTPRIATVRMDLAIQFKEFAATDVVYMPAGNDYKVKQLAFDYLKQEPIIEVRNG